MATARPMDTGVSRPLCDPSTPLTALFDSPTVPSVLEMLRTDAELPSIGLSRFSGTLKERNALWRDYRNFLRQAISNYRAVRGAGAGHPRLEQSPDPVAFDQQREAPH